MAKLAAEDAIIIVVYFVLVIGFGLVSSLKNRGSTRGYFLAGRNMHWIPVGASLFASNIGTGHFIGLTGSGAAGGIAIAGFELNALFVLLILGWVFIPLYTVAGVFTTPEYMTKRYGGERIRIYLAVLALILSIFTKVSADLFAGAISIAHVLEWNLYGAVILLLAVAAVFTIMGGLTAVIWTDFIQTVIMLIGALVLMVLAFIKVGGYEGVRYKWFRAVSNTTLYYKLHPEEAKNYSYSECGYPNKDAFHLFRPATDPDVPWTGMVFGLTVSAVWYWCTDQVIVQRALAAKDISSAKFACILAGYTKVLPMWIMVIPGMIARILYPDTIACADPDMCEKICNQRAGCTNIAYLTLVLELMPVGAQGLMLAVMMAALISSLTSVFNSSATIFTMDVWRKIRKSAGDIELMIVGRVFVLVMVVIAVIWLPVVQNFAELFQYIQKLTSYLAPPICSVYVVAAFWKRGNEQGAFWSLMIGLAVGLTRTILEFVYLAPPCGRGEVDPRPSVLKDVNYLHFGIILFGICAISNVIISLFTKPLDDKHLTNLTFWDKGKVEEDRLNNEKIGIDNLALDTGVSASIATVDKHEPTKAIPAWRKVVNWLCGIEKMQEPLLTEAEQKLQEDSFKSIHEEPRWRWVGNINGAILCVVAVTFYAFFY